MEENSNIPLLSQDEQLARIEYYFPELTDAQREQFRSLAPLYGEWNAKINVISRKDIGNLYLHHVLHSSSPRYISTWWIASGRRYGWHRQWPRVSGCGTSPLAMRGGKR